jgi:hypothetical protein
MRVRFSIALVAFLVVTLSVLVGLVDREGACGSHKSRASGDDAAISGRMSKRWSLAGVRNLGGCAIGVCSLWSCPSPTGRFPPARVACAVWSLRAGERGRDPHASA